MVDDAWFSGTRRTRSRLDTTLSGKFTHPKGSRMSCGTISNPETPSIKQTLLSKAVCPIMVAVVIDGALTLTPTGFPIIIHEAIREIAIKRSSQQRNTRFFHRSGTTTGLGAPWHTAWHPTPQPSCVSMRPCSPTSSETKSMSISMNNKDQNLPETVNIETAPLLQLCRDRDGEVQATTGSQPSCNQPVCNPPSLF